MTPGDSVENLIRSTLRTAVQAEEPSAAVRDSLLAAAQENAFRSAVGPAIPPLAKGLQECEDPALDLTEQVITSIPLARKQLLWLAAPVYAVR